MRLELQKILPDGASVPERSIVLVCGNVYNGTQLLQREAEEKGCVYGVECKSVAEIAKLAAAESVTARGQFGDIEPVEDGAFLLYDVVRTHAAELPYDRMKYPTPAAFQQHLSHILTINTARELLRVINMVRMNKREAHLRRLSSGHDRLQRVMKVLELYQSALEERSLYDTPRLLQTAVTFLHEMKEKGLSSFTAGHDYYLLNDFTPTALEEELLALLQVNAEPVTVPEGKNVTHRFVSAYGLADELRYVANDILARGIYPGEAVLYYPSGTYEPLIRSVFAAQNIPVCFPTGTGAAESDCFLLVTYLLDWVHSNYRMDKLRTVLFDPALAFFCQQGKQEWRISKGEIDSYLLRSGFLFGRDSYLALAAHADAPPTLHPDSEGKLSSDERSALAAYVTNRFIRSLMTLTKPDSGSEYDIHAFLGRLLTFLDENSNPAGLVQMELSALKEMLEGLRTATEGGILLSLDETSDFLRSAIMNTTIGSENSSECVSACLLGKRELLSARQAQYLVGLSSDLMLQSTNESPVMYDSEITACLDGVPKPLLDTYLGETVNEVRRRTAEKLIHTLPDNAALTFSYPYYDQAQLYRRSKTDLYEKYESAGTPVLDYNTLDPHSESFLYEQQDVPDEAEEKTVDNIVDFLMGEEKKLRELQEQGRENGLSAKERKALTLSDSDLEELRVKAAFPTREKLSVSATSLHTLLRCPMLYALRYRYHVSEEPTLDPARTDWLDARQKGLFFHKLMELYLTESFSLPEKGVLSSTDSRCPDFDKSLYDTLFEQVLQTYEYLPVPVERVKQEQKQTLYDKGISYLSGMLQDMKSGDPYRPCKMEYHWQEPKTPETISLPPLTENDLPNASPPPLTQNGNPAIALQLDKGEMDRLDSYTDESGIVHFRIIDYKTGRLEFFLEEYRDILVQHYVYCRGLRSSLGQENCVVDSFVFVFPFEEQASVYTYQNGSFVYQGEGSGFSRIEITGADLDELSDHAKKLLSRFVSNKPDVFEHRPTLLKWLNTSPDEAPSDDPCAYCQFKNLCGVIEEERGKTS